MMSSDTRAQILDAAWTLLAASPPVRTRMGDIAAAAGVSRQAVYLHFANRTELLVETARHMDRRLDVDARLAASRAATGVARLDAWVAAWGGYMPEIQGVARAFLAARATDEAAAAAWADRMAAVRDGCAAAVRALAETGVLKPHYPPEIAADLLAALLSFETWNSLRFERGWPQERYIEMMQRAARDLLTA